MLDPFDYKEPACALCGGEDFYYPNKDKPLGAIPVNRIIEKVDACYEKNDLQEAKRLLVYWQNEAINLKDLQGELSISSELIGLYRKTLEKELALETITRAIELLDKTNLNDTVSGATILLNCATTLKAFGKAEKAMPLYRKTEKIYQEKLQPNDSNFGGLYNNMALALVDLNKIDDAFSCYNKALSIMKATENGKLECAITYVNMAQLFYDLENSKKAKECVKEAINYLQDKSIVQNGYYAFVIDKCAPALEFFGEEKIAKELTKIKEDIYARAWNF